MEEYTYVGLDELVTIDGAGDVQKSSFTLSPTVAHSANGRKNQSQLSFAPASSRKRSLETHRNSVSNVTDLRLHKRCKDDEDDDCIIIDPAAVEYKASESSGLAEENPRSKKVVTPSPHPHTKSANNDSTSFSRGDSTTTRLNLHRSIRRRAILAGQTTHAQSEKALAIATGRRGFRKRRSKRQLSRLLSVSFV